MNDPAPAPERPRRLWPWVAAVVLLLGFVSFLIWMWFAVQNVKRIKASTDQAALKVER